MDDYYEVTKGLKAGERVVTSANFLIDSESKLKEAMGGNGSAWIMPDTVNKMESDQFGVQSSENEILEHPNLLPLTP